MPDACGRKISVAVVGGCISVAVLIMADGSVMMVVGVSAAVVGGGCVSSCYGRWSMGVSAVVVGVEAL